MNLRMGKYLWGLVLCCSMLPPVFAQQKPNIILIVADDLGYGELGCYGQQMIHTPHIDALARSGMRFTDYYAGSSVCAPSRECLLTGYHTGHTAIRGNFRLEVPVGNLPMATDHPTLAAYLKKAGYRTALFGKWGLGDPETGPNTRGFDYSWCYIDQVKAHNYYPPYLWKNDKKVILEANKNGKEALYSHSFFVDKTLDYIRHADQEPFFLYLPYTLPHGDYTLPPDTTYRKKKWPEHFQVYASMVSLLDADVGRIVRLLKQKGIADHTVIVFTSDNGANPGAGKFFKGNGIFRGAKRELYEGGIREPLIVSWPGTIQPGQLTGHITAAWDLLPTLCEIAGISPQPSQTDGVSFLPELLNQQQAGHRFLYWEYYHYNFNYGHPSNRLPRNWLESQAARMGKWKAVKTDQYHNKNAKIELYNLQTDPTEQQNIAGQHPAVVAQMKEIFKEASVPDPPYFPFDTTLHKMRR